MEYTTSSDCVHTHCYAKLWFQAPADSVTVSCSAARVRAKTRAHATYIILFGFWKKVTEDGPDLNINIHLTNRYVAEH